MWHVFSFYSHVTSILSHTSHILNLEQNILFCKEFWNVRFLEGSKSSEVEPQQPDVDHTHLKNDPARFQEGPGLSTLTSSDSASTHGIILPVIFFLEFYPENIRHEFGIIDRNHCQWLLPHGGSRFWKKTALAPLRMFRHSRSGREPRTAGNTCMSQMPVAASCWCLCRPRLIAINTFLGLCKHFADTACTAKFWQ